MGFALQHLHNGGLAATAMIQTTGPGQHLVTVKTATHLARTQIQIIAAILGLQKAEPVTMTDDHPPNQIHLLRYPVGAPAIGQQLPIPFHGPQAAAHGFNGFIIMQVEFSTDLAVGERLTPVIKQLQDVVAAGHGVIVFFGFFVEVRVVRPGPICHARFLWLRVLSGTLGS